MLRALLSVALASTAALLVGCGGDPAQQKPAEYPNGPLVLNGANGTYDCQKDPTAPRNPSSGQVVCGPFDNAVVFFAPHPDDETLGMAGAIRAALAEGRPVYVEVLTKGETSRARAILNNGRQDSWHPGAHQYNLSEAEFGEARAREVTDSSARLGVTGIYINSFPNGGLTEQHVQSRIAAWLSRGHNLQLRGTAGEQDPRGNEPAHPDHVVVWHALVAASRAANVQGYLVYGHEFSNGRADAINDITPFCEAKRAAIGAYRVWDPPHGRYAIGAHSTPELFDKAGADCKEMIVHPGAAPAPPPVPRSRGPLPSR
jgi:LmbE family N-acetylglucosaminyl deacetylase